MKISTTRLEAFSDGIIAIAITVMVLQMRLPSLDGHRTAEQIVNHLQLLLPYFISYAFSFMMIGILWTNHHHMFHLLEHTDAELVWQNFLFLFFLSLIPVTTGIVGANPLLPLSVSLYAGVLLLTSAAFYLMRSYTMRKRLLHKDRDPELTREIFVVSRKARRKSLIGICCYAGAVPLAFLSVYAAWAVCLVPPVIFFIPEGIDDETLAEKVAEKNG
ncbi:TMEM175 family protein [Flaviaesturariibacter terrae]